LSVPQAALPPEQVWTHAPVVHVTLPHAALPTQVAVQSPVVQLILPHAAPPLPPEQFAVQSPLVQPMLPHACWPMQSTAQFFVLQVMPRHALSAVQSISHDAALVQLIVPHAPGVGHMMLQFQPMGQVILPLPVPMIVHDIVAKLQLPPQMSGQIAASSGLGGASTSGRSPITQ
jgi:hypothetical protein